jgi:cardiolipin synthase
MNALNGGPVWWWVVVLVYALGAVVAVRILLQNRNPVKTASYILLMILFPPLGLVVVFLFGQQFRKQRTARKKSMRSHAAWRRWEDRLLSRVQAQAPAVEASLGHWAGLAALVWRSRGGELSLRNHTQLLMNGEQFFPALFEACRGAQHHIHIEFYIAEEGQVLDELWSILIHKARAGVAVRLILDDVGSKGLPRRYARSLREAGGHIHFFQPVFFPLLSSGAHFRNHRKLAVIDGQTALTGGMNLSDRYLNQRDSKRVFWRDTGVWIQGDAVWSFQAQFLLSWDFVTQGKLPELDGLFPEADKAGSEPVQVVASGPDQDWGSILHATFKIIGDARSYLYIATPYFVPNEQIMTALQTSALSGVDVRIMVPARGDSVITQAATFSYLKPVIEAGAKVYLYQKGFLHAKTLVADDSLAMVGTANMDYRSFDINWELNTLLFDRVRATALKQQFVDDQGHCQPLTLVRWERRAHRRRWLESLARLLAPLL